MFENCHNSDLWWFRYHLMKLITRSNNHHAICIIYSTSFYARFCCLFQTSRNHWTFERVEKFGEKIPSETMAKLRLHYPSKVLGVHFWGTSYANFFRKWVNFFRKESRNQRIFRPKSVRNEGAHSRSSSGWLFLIFINILNINSIRIQRWSLRSLVIKVINDLDSGHFLPHNIIYKIYLYYEPKLELFLLNDLND